MWAVPRRKIFLCKGTCRNIFELAIKRQIIGGGYIAKFENLFASYIGVKEAVSISSGTAALSLILECLDLKAGDEAILPAYTFPSVPACIGEFGLVLRFVDIDLNTDNIDILKLEEAINHKTKLIVATHIFGRPCDIETIVAMAKERGIYVIEDCAHAIGSEYKGKKLGSFGDAAYFSFSITKPFNTFNGGMIAANNPELIRKIRGKVEKIPDLPSCILYKNILFSYSLCFLTSPVIFTFFIYPALLLLSLINMDLIRLYNKTFKKSVFMGTKKFKFTNLQALVGIKMLDSHRQYFLERANKIKLFNELCMENHIDIGNERIRKHQIIFHYFFVIKHQNQYALAKKMLWNGIDTGKHLMSNCGKLFSDSYCYPNAEQARRYSLQIPIEHCTQEVMGKIIRVLKECGGVPPLSLNSGI